jgi:nucleoid DNA-binding protein
MEQRQNITKEDTERVDNAIIRALRRLRAEGLDVNYRQVKEIYRSQIEFVEDKIKQGGFEEIKLPGFVKFTLNIKSVQSYLRRKNK